MPTTRPRHTLTETDELAAALERAAARWPQDAGSKRKLLLRLIEEGDRALTEDDDRDARRQRRIEAVKRTSGIFTGLYPPGYLEEFRREWPE